jgi:hypothetical protein
VVTTAAAGGIRGLHPTQRAEDRDERRPTRSTGLVVVLAHHIAQPPVTPHADSERSRRQALHNAGPRRAISDCAGRDRLWLRDAL